MDNLDESKTQVKIISDSRPTTIVIEGATLALKNLSGRKSRYNNNGDRVFTLVMNLSEKDLKVLREMGLNVKEREYKGNISHNLKVRVSYRFRPPTVALIRDNEDGGPPSIQRLDEASVSVIDQLATGAADAEITLSRYSLPNGDVGSSAYLKSLYVKYVPSYLEGKYDAYTE